MVRAKMKESYLAFLTLIWAICQISSYLVYSDEILLGYRISIGVVFVIMGITLVWANVAEKEEFRAKLIRVMFIYLWVTLVIFIALWLFLYITNTTL